MNRALLPAALFAMALAAPAHADSRLVERLYNPDEVVLLQGQVNVQATIKFGESERIENVAIGDSTSWQVTPNKRANLLFVKPLEPEAATNMTVVTDRHTYLFDLVAGPKTSPVYVLAFTYPEPIEPVVEHAALPGQATPMEVAAATDPYAVVDPTQLNFAWSGTGDQKLLPSRAFDDGEATFLSWPADRPVPAILVRNIEGVEGPVNFAVRGDTIVVDGVPREIVLRSGDDLATLLNEGPARDAPPAERELAHAGKVK